MARVGDFAGGDLERGDAVADVVVGAARRQSGAHGQHRLGAVQRLHLRLLVHAQHDRLVGRVQVQADAIADLHATLDQTDDDVERLKLRQQLLELQHPPLERYEAAFVKHAKAWADNSGVTADAFAAEGVPAAVLRRAGIRGVTNGGTRRTRRTARTTGRRRVSADEVRKAIPTGTFTVKDVQEASGASAAVVRRVIGEEVDAGNVTDQGPDPNHTGPGRAPTVYHRQ